MTTVCVAAVVSLWRPGGVTWVGLPARWNAWAVITMAIWLQALPFLLLGVVVSATISVWVPREWLARVLPAGSARSVPRAGVAGMLLPGCECASVPAGRSLVRAGASPAAALTFMLAAPAINPVVLVATAIAYRADPRMVLARFAASLAAAVLVGYLWSVLGTSMEGTDADPDGSCQVERLDRWRRFRDELTSDFLQAAGFLVLGGAAAATVKTFVPVSWIAAVGHQPIAEALTMAALAVLVALCSEADAFMAVSLTAFSPTAQLVFLVIGPMVDVKLMAMQAGAFGTRFVTRFVTITAPVCVLTALAVGHIVW